jgi:Tfp pilus assembly protein PilN
MSQINFLSDQFLREQGRRNRLGRQVLLIVMVCLAMVAWGATAWRQLAVMKADLASRSALASDLARQTEQYVQMQQRFNDLRYQAKVQQELLMPITVTQVIATLGQLMPDSHTCSKLVVRATEPTPRPVAAEASKTAPRSVETPVMRVEIVGLAPTDTDVANFVDQLTAHPIFEAVKLDYTRPQSVASVTAREFRIEMQIPLNRLYVPASPRGEEVAHAG